MSRPPSLPPTGCRSARVTVRFIIFTAGGERVRTMRRSFMPNITRRKLVRAGAAGGAAALAAPSLARAQAKRWRMVTSWPKRLPGPGMSAERVADRIRTLSGGKLDIAVHAAGEIVPAFEV